MSPKNVTHEEVQSLLWDTLKWVVLVGLSLAFGLGAWATDLRADVNHALSGVEQIAHIREQLDSLRIEQRHMSDTEQEIKQILLKRK